MGKKKLLNAGAAGLRQIKFLLLQLLCSPPVSTAAARHKEHGSRLNAGAGVAQSLTALVRLVVWLVGKVSCPSVI